MAEKRIKSKICMNKKELKRKLEQASCNMDDFEVVVLDKKGGYHEIEDVLFSRHGSGVLTITIIEGEKFL